LPTQIRSSVAIMFRTSIENEVPEVLRAMSKKGRSRFFSRNKFLFRDIAKDRIKRLFSLAEQKLRTDPDLSREYVSIAIRIGTRCRVRLPTNWKWRICRGCNTLLSPGLNCTVRIRPNRQPHLVIRCLYCGRISRRNVNRTPFIPVQ
jgi:ribonuclease P protein subunit RPR2